MSDPLEIAVAALRRLASPTEMAGMGETESMTGPAAVEMRVRMRHAELALAECAPISAPSDHETIDDAGKTP